MSSSGSLFATRPFAFVGAAVVLLSATVVQAQSGISSSSSQEAAISGPHFDSTSYSSSTDSAFTDFSSAGPAVPASPAGGRGQYDNRGRRQGLKWGFEAGGGFNAPISKDIPNITW